MHDFSDRRAKFTRALGEGVAVIPGAALRTRNNDTHFEFRQTSDLLYLTGYNEPDAVLVIAPHHQKERNVLFVLPRDRSKEIWDGKRFGIEGAIHEFGMDAAYEISELETRLPDYLVGAKTLFYALDVDPRRDRIVLDALMDASGRVRRGGQAPESITDPATILHEMRLVKSTSEIETMRRAGAITRLGHIAGMRATRPGLPEYELQATIEYAYRKNGAQALAYQSIVASGDNATILHYNSNRETMRDGTLVLVDSGCELDGYASDVTRTWPVNGKFSVEQRAIYEVALAAQKAGIEQVRPGNLYSAPHDAAVRTIVDGLLCLGLLKGSRDENIETEKYKDYYYHNTGHWIGLDVHDPGRYRDNGKEFRKLEAGMTLTVEPGVYVPRDLQCDERFKGIGVRIEDDILCAATRPEVLSADIPKEIDEVESIVGADAVSAVS